MPEQQDNRILLDVPLVTVATAANDLSAVYSDEDKVF